MSRFWSKGGWSSTATDHKGPIGPLTFDPLIHILPDFLDMQNLLYMNHLGDPINLRPISSKSNQFENLIPVQKVNDLLTSI